MGKDELQCAIRGQVCQEKCNSILTNNKSKEERREGGRKNRGEGEEQRVDEVRQGVPRRS